MTLAKLLTRFHGAWLVMIGSVTLPKVPLEEVEIAMAWDNVKASIQQLEDAIARAAANKSNDAAALAQAQADTAAANSALNDAEAQIVALLQPAVDAANNLAPPPPPPPAA